MNIELKKILEIYEKEVSKNMKNKEKVYRFERYKMMNINRIYLLLQDSNYHGGYYNIFLIKYPKYRIVMSLNTIDKVINHYATRYFLMPELEKKLDIRNVATRKGMGRDYGIRLLKKYMNEMKTRGEFYALKLDISKYFYTIDHNILKEMLKKDLKNDSEYQFLCHIIDSTNRPYINHRIQSLKEKELKTTKRKKEVEKIPFYDYGKGLPIGYEN